MQLLSLLLMKKARNNISRLKYLTFITSLVLAGVIVLQFYWLYTSYTEQQSRFKADIENALTATAIKIQVESSLQHTSIPGIDSLRKKGISDIVSKAVGKLPREMLKGRQNAGEKLSIRLNAVDLTAEEIGSLIASIKENSAAVNESAFVVQNLVADTAIYHKTDLTRYVALFKEELDKRVITTPFEMALTDYAGTITIATCDTGDFRKIPLQSSAGDFSHSFLPDDLNLKVAFPDANLYLVKRMAWIMSVTILLVLIGSVSLSYLLLLFFRQKKLADMRNDFMNNMTHELKTPISAVAVALEMVLDKRHQVPEDKKARYLGIAQGELKRLNLLVENVLRTASFEHNEITIAPEAIEVKTWLEEVNANMLPVLETKNAVTAIHVDPEYMAAFLDRTHFTNVMQNLIENALKYNDKEMPEITISAVQAEGGVIFRVKDNGMGIPDAYHEQVFDKFFRVPHGDRHDIKGYGLGLSYVRSVVMLHQGKVSVTSVVDEGSTFHIFIPVKTIYS